MVHGITFSFRFMLASARYKTFNFAWPPGDGKGYSGRKAAVKKGETASAGLDTQR